MGPRHLVPAKGWYAKQRGSSLFSQCFGVCMYNQELKDEDSKGTNYADVELE